MLISVYSLYLCNKLTWNVDITDINFNWTTVDGAPQLQVTISSSMAQMVF